MDKLLTLFLPIFFYTCIVSCVTTHFFKIALSFHLIVSSAIADYIINFLTCFLVCVFFEFISWSACLSVISLGTCVIVVVVRYPFFSLSSLSFYFSLLIHPFHTSLIFVDLSFDPLADIHFASINRVYFLLCIGSWIQSEFSLARA